MNIINLIIAIILFAVETLAITYSVCILAYLLNKSKLHEDKYCFIELFMAIFITLILNHVCVNLLFTEIWIMPTLFTLIIFICCNKIFDLTLVKSTIIASLCTLFPVVIRILINLVLLDFEISLSEITDNICSEILISVGISLLEAAIILIIKNCCKSLTYANASMHFFMPQLFIIFISLLPNMLLLVGNNFKYSKLFIILNTIQMLLITIVNIFNLKLLAKQEITKQELENTICHNQALSKINEGVRGFKHDMGNIVQAIMGYVAINDAEGAKSYCQNLVLGFNDINTLSILSPETIDDPGIYSIIANKLLEARENNMSLTLDITTCISKINFPMFELSRTLGILLDNAIEASGKTNAKKLIINIYHDYHNNSDVIIISNSINDINIDVSKIFNKDYSTKTNPSGFGLYEIKKFLKKYSQGCITTSIDENNKLFTQTLTIYNT